MQRMRKLAIRKLRSNKGDNPRRLRTAPPSCALPLTHIFWNGIQLQTGMVVMRTNYNDGRKNCGKLRCYVMLNYPRTLYGISFRDVGSIGLSFSIFTFSREKLRCIQYRIKACEPSPHDRHARKTI